MEQRPHLPANKDIIIRIIKETEISKVVLFHSLKTLKKR